MRTHHRHLGAEEDAQQGGNEPGDGPRSGWQRPTRPGRLTVTPPNAPGEKGEGQADGDRGVGLKEGGLAVAVEMEPPE